MNEVTRATAKRTAKTFAVIVVSIALSLGALKVVFASSAQTQQEAQATTIHLLRAVGCELGVPSSVIGHSPDGNDIIGRDPVVLRACWTDEGLQPPAYFDEG